jgi:hypothetical protein
MRKISYAGTWLYTGDDIAEALLGYARALARRNSSDTVFVPGRTAFGLSDRIEVLIGPASQIVSETVDALEPDIADPSLVRQLKALTEEVEPQRSAPAPIPHEETDVGYFDSL